MWFASLAELPFGDVNKTHGDEASRRLDAFDAVLITERLNEARPVLAAKLGWRLPRDVAVPWRNKGSPEEEEYSEAALAALEARNAIDRAVYARAARAFDASLRSRGACGRRATRLARAAGRAGGRSRQRRARVLYGTAQSSFRLVARGARVVEGIGGSTPPGRAA